MDDFDGHDRPLPCPNCQRPDYSCKCRSIPAPGADLATDELKDLLTAATNASFDCGAHDCDDDDNPDVVPYEELARIAHEKREAVLDLFRTTLAAVPASEPVRLMNFGTDGPAPWSGAHNACDLTKSVTTTYSNSAQIAAPAPVSGMPDLAQRRVIFGICDAYESGMGHGLQRDGHKSGAIWGDPGCGIAYEIGYEQGVERADDDKIKPPRATLPAAPAPTEQAGELPPLPVLPPELLNMIGEYGMARTDGLGDLDRIHVWELLIDGIKAYARHYARAALAARQAPLPTDFLMPEAAWNEYATRSGLLNEHGVAPDPAKTQAAYFAYIAAWNRLHAAFSAYIVGKRHLISSAAARQAPTEGRKEPLSEAQLDHIARSYFAEPHAQESAKNAIHDAFLEARQAPDSRDAARLDLVYRLAMVEPFIAPIATKETWLASVDARIAQEKAQ